MQFPPDFLGPIRFALWAVWRILSLAVLVWVVILLPILLLFKVLDWWERRRK